MRIPILLYHRLLHNELNREKYEISGEEFERQVRYLSTNGFQTISLSDLFKQKNNIINNTKKGVIITFDDGNYSDYSIAFPILKKYGFSAVFFITVNWIGSKNFVDWPHLKEMVSNGMSIQSHSLSHSFLSDLSVNNLYKELYKSKNTIEDTLNAPVRFLSIPGGFLSKKVLTMAKEAGYSGVCTSSPGMNDAGTKKREFNIFNRFVITRKTTFRNFQLIVEGDLGYIARCKAEYGFKAVSKKLLGSKRYYAIWSKFFKAI